MIGEDLQLRMPTTDEQLAINTNAHLTESEIVWASYTGAREQFDRKERGESIRANNMTTKDRFTITYDPDSYIVTVTKPHRLARNQ